MLKKLCRVILFQFKKSAHPLDVLIEIFKIIRINIKKKITVLKYNLNFSYTILLDLYELNYLEEEKNCTVHSDIRDVLNGIL